MENNIFSLMVAAGRTRKMLEPKNLRIREQKGDGSHIYKAFKIIDGLTISNWNVWGIGEATKVQQIRRWINKSKKQKSVIGLPELEKKSKLSSNLSSLCRAGPR